MKRYTPLTREQRYQSYRPGESSISKRVGANGYPRFPLGTGNRQEVQRHATG